MSAIYFSKEHEWAMVEGNVAKVGISEYAASELGDVTFVDLPDVGKQVRQDDFMAAIESVKAASDIYAPVSGKVISVNNNLEDDPEQVNRSPEQDAWMVKLEISDVAELAGLMSREQYLEYIKTL
ncbi:MAG: glycine cleavage system protein GcvH [Trichlorobacter sp.]|nr:glycine cleavage system protein GcvH [Trichlorobacter sp.]